MITAIAIPIMISSLFLVILAIVAFAVWRHRKVHSTCMSCDSYCYYTMRLFILSNNHCYSTDHHAQRFESSTVGLQECNRQQEYEDANEQEEYEDANGQQEYEPLLPDAVELVCNSLFFLIAASCYLLFIIIIVQSTNINEHQVTRRQK